VVFWKFANNTESEDGEDSPKSGSRLLFTRGYSVFNSAQVDGYTPKAESDMPIRERSNAAEQFFRWIGADFRHGGNQVFYSVDGISFRCRCLGRSMRTSRTIRRSYTNIPTTP